MQELPAVFQLTDQIRELLLPRGLLDETLENLKSANAGYEIADKREGGTKIDLAFKAELYDEQKLALTEMLKNDTGILSAGNFVY